MVYLVALPQRAYSLPDLNFLVLVSVLSVILPLPQSGFWDLEGEVVLRNRARVWPTSGTV